MHGIKGMYQRRQRALVFWTVVSLLIMREGLLEVYIRSSKIKDLVPLWRL